MTWTLREPVRTQCRPERPPVHYPGGSRGVYDALLPLRERRVVVVTLVFEGFTAAVSRMTSGASRSKELLAVRLSLFDAATAGPEVRAQTEGEHHLKNLVAR